MELVQLEMEKDNAVSHGASGVLSDRLFKSCDPFSASFCKNCGNIAITNYMTKEYNCRKCGFDSDKCSFGICSIPYSFKKLIQTLMGAGIKIGVSFDKPEIKEIKEKEKIKTADSDDEEEIDEEEQEAEEIAELAEYFGEGDE